MRTYETKRTKLPELRRKQSVTSNQHALMVVFRSILETQCPSGRVIGVLDLEQFLSLRCEEQSAIAHNAYREARDMYHDNQTPENSMMLARALDEWDKQSVQLEHLWRELSQLYMIDPTTYSGLAMLAAQHLLDGFSLELMDGDSGVMNLPWIKGILNALKHQLGGAKVLVLSILGVQSSGKSTLLNYMFGVRLRTSVSRCTRGVNIQLLKCEGRSEYEYIILLDTEGIRAPERIGMEDGIWLDNRMATLSILPADATIILTKGESTITISEILPIVLSAYLESEVAQTYGGRLPSKLLFVFNQIDLAEKSKLENIVDTLMHELSVNAKKVAEIRHGMHLRNAEDAPRNPTKSFRGANVFDHLKYDITDEENSDVRVLGTIKAQSYPPHDAPLPDYGHRILQLREHIHRQVCDGGWNGRTMDEFGEFISMVWKCIECSNFQLNFIAAYERINYDQLVTRVNDYMHRLTDKYCAAFDEISMNIRQSSDDETNNKDINVESLRTKFSNDLEMAIFKDVSQLDVEVQSIISEECYSKWATDQLSRWSRHKNDQAEHWRKLVYGQVDNVFCYDTFVTQYKMQLRSEANALFGNGRFKYFNEDQITLKFDEIFDQLSQRAYDKHPPLHPKVREAVQRVFLQTNQTVISQQEKSLFSDLHGRMVHAVGRLFDPSRLAKLENKLELTISRKVQGILSTVCQYDDATVLKCIHLTRSMLLDAEIEMHVRDELKSRVYDNVKEKICVELEKIQLSWDQKNGVAVRFAASKDEMKTYFENLGKGFDGMKLLQNIVCDWLERNMYESFLEQLVVTVGVVLKDKRWVSDADVMQAMVDNSLVKLIETNQVNCAIELINYPPGHIDDILSDLIESEVKRCYEEKLKQFTKSLIQCIKNAAGKAYQAKKDRAVCFLSWLKSGLRDLRNEASHHWLHHELGTV
ncbi:unnamed protein product [Aphanomyces euteiches]|nr:hypothetical protein Ae201684P_009495 [Aphanomyces euteiches]KAH9144752.1 hypothetical protein AeRB84_011312 [Aphanomyces euteiches]